MSWLDDRADDRPGDLPGDLLGAVGPDLAGQIEGMRREAALATPGRTGELISLRAQQMVTGVGSSNDLGPLTDAEQLVVALAEQFLLDAHGIDDSMVAALGQYFTPAEQVAIMFHLALADGFTKFDRIFSTGESH